MKPKKDRYKETIEVYKKLGKKYVQDISKATPKEFVDFIKFLPKGGLILDVGCAGGRDSRKFIQKGFKVIGVDLVDVYLEEARKYVPRAKFIKMDLLKLKFPKDHFDAIWACAVLLHIEKSDISQVLRGFRKVLKPSGKLYVRVKKGIGVGSKREKLSAGQRRVFTYFSKDEIKEFVEKAGFKIISTKIHPDELGRKDINWIAVFAEK